MYGHETLTLEEFYEALCSKETMKQLVNGFEVKAEGLVTRGRSQEKVSRNSEKGRSKFKIRNKSYKYCMKKGHVIDDCYKLHNKNKETTNQKEEQPMNSRQVSVAEDDHSDGELVDISDGDSKPFKEWVLCTFHMCPNQDWFSTMKLCQAVPS